MYKLFCLILTALVFSASLAVAETDYIAIPKINKITDYTTSISNDLDKAQADIVVVSNMVNSASNFFGSTDYKYTIVKLDLTAAANPTSVPTVVGQLCATPNMAQFLWIATNTSATSDWYIINK